MKKIIIIFISLFIITQSYACPFCGCGGGNLYMGLLPDYQSQFFSLRYNFSQYHTVLASDTSQHSNNYYNTIEFSYGIHIKPKLQLLVFVPYNLNKQIDDDGTTTKNGFGDISFLAQYEVFHHTKFKKNHSAAEQEIWLGAGLKLPTGTFGLDISDPDVTLADVNAQLGTGSTDFLLNGLYSLRLGNFGANINATYKINSAHEGIKFGNKFTSNAIAYYHFNLKNKKSSISPNIGINYEHVDQSSLPENLKTYIPYTNSHVFTVSTGIEYNYKKIGFGISAQLPAEQNFAQNQTQLKFRGFAHVTFAF